MACGCSKKGLRNTTSPRNIVRSGSIKSQSTSNNTIRTQNINAPQVKSQGLDTQRKQVEKARRDSLRNKFGK